MNTFSGNQYSKEIELLLQCSGMNLSDSTRDRISELVAQGIDWEIFKKLAIYHRMLFVALKNLAPVKDKIPKEYQHQFKEMAISSGAQSLFLGSFLEKILSAFEKENIFVMPFKGPVLAEQVYTDVVLKPFFDLDILVDKDDVPGALDILTRMGLSPQFDFDTGQLQKFIANEDHIVCYGFQQGLNVKLHWELSGLYLNAPLTVEKLKNCITAISFNDREVPCLSVEALIVYFCVHGAKHRWHALEQIFTVAELIKANQAIEWHEIEALADAWQCKKMVFLGLYLASKLLKAPVPFTLFTRAETYNVPKLVTKTIDDLLNRPVFRLPDAEDRFSYFHIRVRDSFFDKGRYLLRLLLRPTYKEWYQRILPAPLSCLHYFFRPLRLLFLKLMRRNA